MLGWNDALILATASAAGAATEGGIGMLGSSMANSANADIAYMNNAFNAEQAEVDRQWQLYMANTAYQRAVADMRAAGLNPLLATKNGGAATGSGAQATSSGNPVMQNPLADFASFPEKAAQIMGDVASGTLDVERSKQIEPEVNRITAQTSNINANTAKTIMETKGVDSSNKEKAARALAAESQSALMQAENTARLEWLNGVEHTGRNGTVTLGHSDPKKWGSEMLKHAWSAEQGASAYQNSQGHQIFNDAMKVLREGTGAYQRLRGRP